MKTNVCVLFLISLTIGSRLHSLPDCRKSRLAQWHWNGGVSLPSGGVTKVFTPSGGQETVFWLTILILIAPPVSVISSLCYSLSPRSCPWEPSSPTKRRHRFLAAILGSCQGWQGEDSCQFRSVFFQETIFSNEGILSVKVIKLGISGTQEVIFPWRAPSAMPVL